MRSYDGGEDAWVGVGLAYGITDDIELGGLVLPVRLDESDIDDLEFYGRFRFVDGPFELGAQVTLQLPTYTELGLGLGLPMLAHAGRRLRIDTGFEIEMLFWEPETVVNLDVPLAFTWDVGRQGFFGPRTGFYVWNGDTVLFPAGIHGGGTVARGQLDITGWFMWPALLATDRDDDPFDVRTIEIGFGLNARVR